jgi:transcriptional regulator with XRE-family HTH domain
MSRQPRRARDGEMFDTEAGVRMRRFFDRLRVALDLETDAELWRRLGISRDAAQAWMRGERPPSRAIGERVAERAGISYPALLAIYKGEEQVMGTATIIAALEWAISQVRSGEWSPIRTARPKEAPEGYVAEADKVADRSAAQRRTRHSVS